MMFPMTDPSMIFYQAQTDPYGELLRQRALAEIYGQFQPKQQKQGVGANDIYKAGKGIYDELKTPAVADIGLQGAGALSSTGGLAADAGVASATGGGTILADGSIAPLTSGASTVPTDITNFAGEATPVLGAAGTVIGGYNALKGIQKGNPLRAGLGAGGAVLGLNAMGYALGPAGIAATIGVPVIASLGKRLFGHKPKTKDAEQKRFRKLIESGVNVPNAEALIASIPKQSGMSRAELVQDAKNRGETEQAIKFAGTRNEADLKGSGESIINRATFAEKIPNWFNLSRQQQINIANQFLDAGAAREHHGTWDIDTSKVKFDPNYQVKIPVAKDPNINRQMGESFVMPDGINRGVMTPNGVMSTLIGTAPRIVGSGGETKPPPVVIPRSKTRSPGISLDGRRISY